MRVALIISTLCLSLGGCAGLADIMETEYVYVRSSGPPILAVATAKLASNIPLGCQGMPTVATTNVRSVVITDTHADEPERRQLNMQSMRQCDRR